MQSNIDPICNNLSWGDSVMLAACLRGYHEVTYIWLFGKQCLSLHKGHCCPTWVPRKANLEFAKVQFYFAKNSRFRMRILDESRYMYWGYVGMSTALSILNLSHLPFCLGFQRIRRFHPSINATEICFTSNAEPCWKSFSSILSWVHASLAMVSYRLFPIYWALLVLGPLVFLHKNQTH